MKLILCTLAICLSILASVFTTKELIRAEGKKIRSSFPKALTEPADAAGRTEPLVQRLDAMNAQLGNMNRRLSSLEEASLRQAATVSAPPLVKNTAGLTTTLTKLDAVPNQLAEITTYLDQSFEHLEKTVTETAAPQQFAESLENMSKRIDAIDSYFTPLYAFLGVVYDPSSQDLMASYPSVDVRINELFLQVEAVRNDVSDLREYHTPHNIDPVKRPR